MTSASRFVELSRALHDRERFSCGKPELDTFLKTRALQHQKVGTSRTLVLTDAMEDVTAAKARVLAFFSVSVTSIERETLPEAIRKTLPWYPVPCFLIGQLAVDQRAAGQGLGGVTLVSAIRYLARVHAELPAVAILVDCLDDDAESFYRHYGFQSLESGQSRARLFMPMKTALAV